MRSMTRKTNFITAILCDQYELPTETAGLSSEVSKVNEHGINAEESEHGGLRKSEQNVTVRISWVLRCNLNIAVIFRILIVLILAAM